MKIKRIELSYDKVGPFDLVTISGAPGKALLTLGSEKGPEFLLTTEQATQLKEVIDELVKTNGNQGVPSASAEDINRALLNGTLGIGQNGLAQPERQEPTAACERFGEIGTWGTLRDRCCANCQLAHCKYSARLEVRINHWQKLQPEEILLLLENKKIQCIKAIRNRISPCPGLKEVKDAVEQTAWKLCLAFENLPRDVDQCTNLFRPAL